MVDFEVKFYGVRGSYPVADKAFMKYGGNTSCITMRVLDKLFIFDAGTGILKLGNEFENNDNEIYMFLTHMHYDHLEGLPFFKPFFKPNINFTIYSENIDDTPLETELSNFIINPMFPFSFNEMKSHRKFVSLNSGDVVNIDDICIHTIENNHPSGGISYKVNYKNKTCCYLTDNELTEENKEKFIDFIKDVDVLITDASYNIEEYETRKGWGHSKWEDVVEVAKAANVKKLVFFHLNPEASDKEIKKRENLAKKIFKNSFYAREGLKVRL